jgi:hypothetical protein
MDLRICGYSDSQRKRCVRFNNPAHVVEAEISIEVALVSNAAKNLIWQNDDLAGHRKLHTLEMLCCSDFSSRGGIINEAPPGVPFWSVEISISS